MASVQTTSFSFHLSKNLKKDAFNIIETYGFTPSQIFNLFLTEIAKTKKIPVDFTYLEPNERTLQAIKEAEEGQVDVISEAHSGENIMENLLRKAS